MWELTPKIEAKAPFSGVIFKHVEKVPFPCSPFDTFLSVISMN